MMHLFNCYCKPILLYAVESVSFEFIILTAGMRVSGRYLELMMLVVLMTSTI